MENCLEFSSPLGDGLVQQKHIHIKHIIQIFVPAWGWVGSWKKEKKMKIDKIFVPEWGWVGSYYYCSECGHYLFSSPSGDGLVPPIVKHSEFVAQFSSPSGVGLVLNAEKMMKVLRSFCPRVGIGWFVVGRQTRGLSLHFRPRVGMGWFCT